MTPKENLLRVIRHDSPEWVPNGMESVVQIEPPIIERPYAAAIDPWGVPWSFEPEAEGGTFPKNGGQVVTDILKWCSQVKVPEVSGLDWSKQLAIAQGLNREETLVCAFIHFGLFERSYLLLGMEEALVAYMTEPEAMDELIGTIADYKIRLIREFHRHIPFDIVLYGDDWGEQHNLFMRPNIWRKIIKPHTKRIFDTIHELGGIVNLHSCGTIESVFEDIVEIGADIWNPCQPCNDLAALKKRFKGKISFCGGIDSQFVLARPGVTEDEVRAEVRKRIDEMAEGGGYIAAPSHGVPYKKNLIDAMNDEISVYGRQFYR